MLKPQEYREIVQHVVQCRRQHTRILEEQRRYDVCYADLIIAIKKYPIEDGDQEETLNLLEEEGYEITKWDRKLVYDAFEAAGVVQRDQEKRKQAEKEQEEEPPLNPRVEVIERHLAGDKQVGKKRSKQAAEAQKEIDEGEDKETRLTKFENDFNRQFNEIILGVKDRCDWMDIEDVRPMWTRWEAFYHKHYDSYVRKCRAQKGNGGKKANEG